jgi:hypothetical protein
LREPRKQPLRLSGRRRYVGAKHDALDAQDDVERFDRRPRRARTFAKAASQAISVDGSPHHLAPDDKADAARRLRGRGGDQLQEAPVMPGTGLEDGFERADAAEAVTGRAARRGRRRNVRQTESRVRPFARRADRTLRPPTVFIRARKPCVRARRSFDG